MLEDCSMKRVFEPGEGIFREGGLANRFYLILNGSVALEHSARKSGPPVLTQIIGPGEVLGWSWLFPPYNWLFDARALERTEAVFLLRRPRIRAKCEEQLTLGLRIDGSEWR